jgi:hypothetical protein
MGTIGADGEVVGGVPRSNVPAVSDFIHTRIRLPAVRVLELVILSSVANTYGDTTPE